MDTECSESGVTKQVKVFLKSIRPLYGLKVRYVIGKGREVGDGPPSAVEAEVTLQASLGGRLKPEPSRFPVPPFQKEAGVSLVTSK